ncbi:MAG TPA: hypothetical protein VGM54_13330 [Chthoniobacter sp.]|jgi:hypothetical protein
MNFESSHHRLDATVIGVIAIDPSTEYIHGLDGSIVACDTVEAMQSWVGAHGLDPASQVECFSYEDLMSSLCLDGVSYHLNAGAAERLLATKAQDERFYPEILRYCDEDGWTMFSSTFDPYKDELEELRLAINEFTLGYLQSDGEVTGSTVSVNSLPLTYQDYERLALSTDRFDEQARGRLASLKTWLWLLKS